MSASRECQGGGIDLIYAFIIMPSPREREHARLAMRAQRHSFQVNPLDRVRGGHSTLIVIAVSETQCVPQLVDRLLDEAIAFEHWVRGQSIKLLPQTMERHHRARSADLSFAEYVCQNRNVEVHAGDAEQPPGVLRARSPHALQDFRRMVLLALSVESKFLLQRWWQTLAD